jgi:hypothetical protein
MAMTLTDVQEHAVKAGLAKLANRLRELDAAVEQETTSPGRLALTGAVDDFNDVVEVIEPTLTFIPHANG